MSKEKIGNGCIATLALSFLIGFLPCIFMELGITVAVFGMAVITFGIYMFTHNDW